MRVSLSRWLPPLAVLILALAIRLYQVDLTRFFNDQLELIQSAAGWLDSGRLPLTSGFTFATTGAQHPPLVTYLLALPMLVSRSPVWLSAWSALLDACAAPVVYLAAQRLTASRLTAVSAGVLYALNPAAIVFARMIWNPDFGMLFAALALYGLVDFAVRGRSVSLALSLAALSWQVQVHVVNLVLAPLWLAVAIAGRRKLRVRPLAIGAAVAVAPLLPYLYLQASTGWADARKLLGYSGVAKVADLSAFDTAAHLAGPAILHSLIPAPGETPLPFHYDALTWLLLALAAAGLALSWRWPRWPRAIVALWLAIPILAAIDHSSDPLSPSDGVAPHYLLAILPAIAIMQALALHDFGRSLKRPTVAAATLVALAVALAVSWAGFLRAAATNTRDVTFGMPLRSSLAAANLVASRTAGQPLYLAVPFLYNRTIPTLAHRADYRWYPDRSVFVFPDPSSAAWYLAQTDTFGYRFLSAHFANPTAGPGFALFHLPPNPQQAAFAKLVPLRTSGPIQIAGYQLETLQAGHTSRLDLLWRIQDPEGIPAHLSHYAHLVDAQGRQLSTAPDLWDVAEPWRQGDLVASSFDLAAPAGTPTGGAWIEVGFYDTFSQQRLGEPVRLGPLRLEGQPSAEPQAAPKATLGPDEIAFESATWQPGGLDVTWRALKAPQAAYTVFVHALDPAGKLVAQWDGPPGGGSFPTTLWRPGDVIHDRYPLALPQKQPLRLEIGMYTQPDVKRLPVQTAGGQQSDHVSVDTASAP